MNAHLKLKDSPPCWMRLVQAALCSIEGHEVLPVCLIDQLKKRPYPRRSASTGLACMRYSISALISLPTEIVWVSRHPLSILLHCSRA